MLTQSEVMNGSPTLRVISVCVLVGGQRELSQWISCSWKTKPTTNPTRDRAEADEEPLPQLVEMLDERRLLAVVEATRAAPGRIGALPRRVRGLAAAAWC